MKPSLIVVFTLFLSSSVSVNATNETAPKENSSTGGSLIGRVSITTPLELVGGNAPVSKVLKKFTHKDRCLPPCAPTVEALPSWWCWDETVSHLTELWGSVTHCRGQRTGTADSDTLTFLLPVTLLDSAALPKSNNTFVKFQYYSVISSWWKFPNINVFCAAVLIVLKILSLL